MDDADLRELKTRAAREANARYAAAVEAQEPVAAKRAELRGVLPASSPVLANDRSVHTFTVYPDDTIEPKTSAER